MTGAMLKNVPVTVTFSVDDLTKAQQFYSDTLGLEVDNSIQGMLEVKLPDNKVLLYGKKNHKPATYTILNFTVNDLKKTMEELKEKGVTFEHYDLPDCKTDENGVVDYGVMEIAFFNDPAGNNHAVLQNIKQN